jgi:starch-binding outer membrane protein SusE/F
LQSCGTAITAPETGQYRVTVNLNNNTYSLLKIDRWSLVGDAVEGGWGGDVPLTYQGKGVWGATIDFYKPGTNAGFLFRANGDWAYLLKRIVGTGDATNTKGNLVMESEAAGMGKAFQDVAGPKEGRYKVTLNLASDVYTYLLEKQDDPEPTPIIIGETGSPNVDQVSGIFTFGDYNTPSELYLLADGVLVGTFEKDGDEFSSVKFWALQQSKTYTINSASDGSGTTYGEVNDGEMGVARDQAYNLIVNFDTGKLTWEYNNMKLFHWADGGWEARQELLMTYEHPYTFKVSGTLSAGFLSKFNSPWDVQFGTTGTALSGTMTNGGADFTGIVANGTYNATIIVTNDFASCEYTFQKQ